MAQAKVARLSFNRGLISPLAAARQDVERVALSADEFVNWMPRVLGSMMLRPGLGYIGTSYSSHPSKSLRFVRSASQSARIEVTDLGMRFWVDDALVTRIAVSTAVLNGTFATDLDDWTDADEAGGTSSWSAGSLSLLGNGTAAAIRTQAVTVAGGDINVEHALEIIVGRGPVIFRVGSTAGGDEYITETTLGTGTHNLAFTPTGTFHITVSNARISASLVGSIQISAAGVLFLGVPWNEAALTTLRYTQSADVLYIGSQGYQPRKVERRGDNSWSLVLYEPENGPFRLVNTGPITIASSAITGDVTLTASKTLFRSGHVGALFKLTSLGQLETASLTGADQFTAAIRVIGVGGQRAFSILITGTWVATITLQMSFDAATWVDVNTRTVNQSISYNDELDNQIIYYRIGIKAGQYTSGTAVTTLVHTSGSTVGVVRITAVASGLSASARVLDTLGAVTATSDWNEGSWSSYRGYPNVPRLFEGRLWWWGRDKVYGSESDLFEDFDDTVEGDAGPIQRSIGEGPIETAHWVAPLQRMLAGTATMSADVDVGLIEGNSPIETRSTSFDDPLTPTNFNTKRASSTAVYVDQSLARLFQADFNVDRAAYEATDLTVMVPDLNAAGITVLGVQHRPDTRIHCRRADGSVGLLIFDRAENVICWCEVETQGSIEDVCILPGEVEDQVYYTVRRTIDEDTVRYHEKWALESECVGGQINKIADSFMSGALVAFINITMVRATAATHTISVTTSGAHGLTAGDSITVTDMVASGTYLLEGEYEVEFVSSATVFRIVVTTKQWVGYFPTGSYVSGGRFPGGAADTITGADHLEGEEVVVWGDGVYVGNFTVTGGEIDLGAEYQHVVYGLGYDARWRSSKNAIAEAVGASLGQPKTMTDVALVLMNTHASGVRYGQDFDHMNALPLADLPKIAGVADEDYVYPEHESRPIPMNGQWKTDSRLCLTAVAPKPACVLAAVATVTG